MVRLRARLARGGQLKAQEKPNYKRGDDRG
jgi:hypothetical protein